MKNQTKLLVSVIYLILAACQKDENSEPFGAGNGQYTFYTTNDLGMGSINILIDNVNVGTINHYSPGGVSCGSGDVNVIKTAGSHTFYARAQSGTTWSGTLNFLEDICQIAELTGNGQINNGNNGTNTGCGWDKGNLIQVVSSTSGGASNCNGYFGLKLQNTSTTKLEVCVKLKKTDGTWDEMLNKVDGGQLSYGGWWTCNGTGEYKIYARVSDNQACSCP